MLYPVFMFKTDSGYDGYFPDVEGCFFAGDSLEETIRDAQKSFSQHAEVLTDMGGYVPAPGDHISLHTDEHLTKDGGFLAFVDIDPTSYETKAVKFNLTMPGNLLSAIDNYITTSGRYKNRSSFLAEIARKEISHH